MIGAGRALACGATDRARDLAALVGGFALPLAALDSFHPEEGMILANSTSIGMQPNINGTPLLKLCCFSSSSSAALMKNLVSNRYPQMNLLVCNL
ncbi:hypothetical protein Taro_006130 [Colocasia esculenta]|uniref:Uncharacterized protein n=1 Tax=Colocasia esculenta TaxID=4460 RepID=A0A843TW81_COLES|nr:hypothetical protein [Colocasia esculenta]